MAFYSVIYLFQFQNLDEEAKKAIEFKRMLDHSQKEAKRFKLENEDLSCQVCWSDPLIG